MGFMSIAKLSRRGLCGLRRSFSGPGSAWPGPIAVLWAVPVSVRRVSAVSRAYPQLRQTRQNGSTHPYRR
jgi:hypothetical protein